MQAIIANINPKNRKYKTASFPVGGGRESGVIYSDDGIKWQRVEDRVLERQLFHEMLGITNEGS